MRKRRNSEEEESSEMDVDDEEKVEANEDSESEGLSEDGEEMNDAETPTGVTVENPFLDSFYFLSSEDGKVRAKAAQTMLQHCLLSSGANSKDAAYAFRRLLNGVCSGRAAARQGNASALASFLKLAFHLEKMDEIRQEHSGQEGMESLSLLAYVRRRLLAATDPNQTTGKKKGSEERDYQFGRLFGILSIVRSSILVTQNSGPGAEAAKGVAADLVADLAELFWQKRWMREPAAHGITTLLRSFCEDDSSAAHKDVGRCLVEEVVIPKVLLTTSSGEEGGSDHSTLVGSFCAEQLGIALFVQSIYDSSNMPFPLNQSILSKETVSLTAQAMSETSVVVQPRTHFVWDSLWCYLSRPMHKSEKKNGKESGQRVLRDLCPGGESSAKVVLDLLVKEVVMQKLLRLELENPSHGKATHERRALALCIVKILLGVPFVSSLSGASRIYLEGDVIESVILTPEIVRALFIDVICAGSEKKKTSHTLKPLALNILNEICEAFIEDELDLQGSRRLAAAQALLSTDIRFDARTKTSTVSGILGLVQPIPEGKASSMFGFWHQYLDHMLSSLLTLCSTTTEDEMSSRATGFVELIYSFAKHVMRLQLKSTKGQAELTQFKHSVVDRILKLFLATAFFNCDNVTVPAESKSQKKKKAKKGKKAGESTMLLVAQQIKESCEMGVGIPHSVRSVISARFFSLLADFAGFATHPDADGTESKVEKDSTTLGILSDIHESWKSLEDAGAKRYCPPMHDDGESIDPQETMSTILKMVKDSIEALAKDPKNSMAESRKRCFTGIGVLGTTLYLHRLSCGESDQDSDDPDADDENDEEGICSALEGLKDVAEDFMKGADEDTNPLLGLAEVCANLLASPIGSGNMGRAASPKLIREAVKFAWLGGLRLASSMASDERSFLDSNVVGTLLEAIGATDGDLAGADDASDDEADGEDEGDDSSNSEESTDDNVFSKAIDVVDDPEDMQVEKSNDSDDSDVELDPTKLQSMLEEDSDANVDEDVLEHHEGADAALAKLIKLKQDTRKAGQQAREKVEISHQLRCTFLLELLLGRFDAWNRVFRTECLIEMLVPMLKLRKKLEKSLNKSLASGTKSGGGEKQALLDRLTGLVNQKICKIKVASLPMAQPIKAEAASEYAFKILGEARRADSQEQFACCSSALVFLLRSTSGVEDEAQLVSLCEEVVTEWSTKRTTKLQASLFDDLIVHLPELSQSLLADPLSKASRNARSPFLKVESFRLLTLLFSSSKPTETGKATADTRLVGIRESFLASVQAALQDEEMRKAKRVRVVLKAMEKLVADLAPPCQSSLTPKLESIKGLVSKLGEGESQGVSAVCNKLVSEIKSKLVELQKANKEKMKETEQQQSPAPAFAVGEWDAAKSSKKKKKKKKR